MATLKEISRHEYTANVAPSFQEIQTGCAQRIATSLENMEKPYLGLLADVDYLNRRHRELQADNKRMARRIAALQGVITRMKSKKIVS